MVCSARVVTMCVALGAHLTVESNTYTVQNQLNHNGTVY